MPNKTGINDHSQKSVSFLWSVLKGKKNTETEPHKEKKRRSSLSAMSSPFTISEEPFQKKLNNTLENINTILFELEGISSTYDDIAKPIIVNFLQQGKQIIEIIDEISPTLQNLLNKVIKNYYSLHKSKSQQQPSIPNKEQVNKLTRNGNALRYLSSIIEKIETINLIRELFKQNEIPKPKETAAYYSPEEGAIITATAKKLETFQELKILSKQRETSNSTEEQLTKEATQEVAKGIKAIEDFHAKNSMLIELAQKDARTFLLTNNPLLKNGEVAMLAFHYIVSENQRTPAGMLAAHATKQYPLYQLQEINRLAPLKKNHTYKSDDDTLLYLQEIREAKKKKEKQHSPSQIETKLVCPKFDFECTVTHEFPLTDEMKIELYKENYLKHLGLEATLKYHIHSLYHLLNNAATHIYTAQPLSPKERKTQFNSFKETLKKGQKRNEKAYENKIKQYNSFLKKNSSSPEEKDKIKLSFETDLNKKRAKDQARYTTRIPKYTESLLTLRNTHSLTPFPQDDDETTKYKEKLLLRIRSISRMLGFLFKKSENEKISLIKSRLETIHSHLRQHQHQHQHQRQRQRQHQPQTESTLIEEKSLEVIKTIKSLANFTIISTRLHAKTLHALKHNKSLTTKELTDLNNAINKENAFNLVKSSFAAIYNRLGQLQTESRLTEKKSLEINERIRSLASFTIVNTKLHTETLQALEHNKSLNTAELTDLNNATEGAKRQCTSYINLTRFLIASIRDFHSYIKEIEKAAEIKPFNNLQQEDVNPMFITLQPKVRLQRSQSSPGSLFLYSLRPTKPAPYPEAPLPSHGRNRRETIVTRGDNSSNTNPEEELPARPRLRSHTSTPRKPGRLTKTQYSPWGERGSFKRPTPTKLTFSTEMTPLSNGKASKK